MDVFDDEVGAVGFDVEGALVESQGARAVVVVAEGEEGEVAEGEVVAGVEFDDGAVVGGGLVGVAGEPVIAEQEVGGGVVGVLFEGEGQGVLFEGGEGVGVFEGQGAGALEGGLGGG